MTYHLFLGRRWSSSQGSAGVAWVPGVLEVQMVFHSAYPSLGDLQWVTVSISAF